MNQEQIDRAVDALSGTCNEEAHVAEELGVDPGEVEAALAEEGWERCACCSWWCESHEMEQKDEETWCEDCRENDDED